MLKSLRIGLVLTMFMAMVTLSYATDVGTSSSKTTNTSYSKKAGAAVDFMFLHAEILRVDRPEGYTFILTNAPKPDNTIINGILNERYRYSLRQNSVTA